VNNVHSDLSPRYTGSKPRESLFLAVEGIDGSGSTTIVEFIASWFLKQQIPVLITGEPSKGPIGRLLKTVYLVTESSPAGDALLFAADRTDHWQKVILPALQQGKVVVSNRHVGSSLVYQVLGGLPEEWVREINKMVPRADWTILLNCDAGVAMERIKRRGKPREKFESPDFLEQARDFYLDLAKRESWIVVESSGPLSRVQKDVDAVLQRVARSVVPKG
jgi:dTMP kinase